MGKSNPFGKFTLKTKEIEVKALDGAKVTIQELSVGKSNEYYGRLFSSLDSEGKPVLNTSAIIDIKLEKVSEAMIDPKMTVEELKELSAQAGDAINEISDAIDTLSSEGN
jgi:hypothetical protein